MQQPQAGQQERQRAKREHRIVHRCLLPGMKTDRERGEPEQTRRPDQGEDVEPQSQREPKLDLDSPMGEPRPRRVSIAERPRLRRSRAMNNYTGVGSLSESCEQLCAAMSPC